MPGPAAAPTGTAPRWIGDRLAARSGRSPLGPSRRPDPSRPDFRYMGGGGNAGTAGPAVLGRPTSADGD